MAKKDLLLIIQGGALCTAFSFLVFMWPIPGLFTKFFSLVPIFYVGIRLGAKEAIISALVPLFWTLLFLGVHQCVGQLLLFVPVILILNWHLFKVNGRYAYSMADILHLFASRFFCFIVACLISLKILGVPWIENLQNNFNEAVKLLQVHAPNNLFEILPSGVVFLWLMMIWLNFQIAYSAAIKAKVAKHKLSAKQNIYLKPVWDIALIASLWLMLLNSIWLDSLFLAIFSRILVGMSAFPLFIDGLEIAQIIAKSNNYPKIALRIFLIFTFMLVWPMIFVVLLGLMEPWYRLKQRYLSKE